MSRRKIVDYKKVFRELISVLDGQQQVVEFVADFERAMWRAIEDVFSRSKMLGGAFYYTQAVFRRLKRIGLTKLYNANATVHLLLKQFMSLHLIPHEKIESQFTRLKAELLQLKLTPVEMAMLDEFFKYFDDTWIVMWSPAKWSVFMQFVRTNNDCEGWHNKINRRAPVTGVNFYKLVPLLRHEARVVPLECELLSQGFNSRRVHPLQNTIHDLLFNAWESYNDREDTTTELLNACAQLYIDANSLRFEKDLDDDKDATYDAEENEK